MLQSIGFGMFASGSFKGRLYLPEEPDFRCLDLKWICRHQVEDGEADVLTFTTPTKQLNSFVNNINS